MYLFYGSFYFTTIIFRICWQFFLNHTLSGLFLFGMLQIMVLIYLLVALRFVQPFQGRQDVVFFYHWWDCWLSRSSPSGLYPSENIFHKLHSNVTLFLCFSGIVSCPPDLTGRDTLEEMLFVFLTVKW